MIIAFNQLSLNLYKSSDKQIQTQVQIVPHIYNHQKLLREMSHNQVPQLQNNKHLCYLLENSHLQVSLPYIDEEYSDLKGKVIYMIINQQKQTMSGVDPLTYLEQLKVPQTPFIDSQRFKKELERVKSRLNCSEQKKKASKGVQIDRNKLLKSKVPIQSLRIASKKIDQSLISYQQSIIKNISLESSKQFSPLIMKQLIQSLQVQKHLLNQKILRQKQEIIQLNRLRKYQQLQAREREQLIAERIKVMVNKRRKIQ